MLIRSVSARRTAVLACVATAWGLASAQASAQASYSEDFENVGSVQPGQLGPSGLISRGWIFRNQSNPIGPGTWYRSDGVQSFAAHTGHWVLATDYSCNGYTSPLMRINEWAILPAIPGQQSGDVMRFFVVGSMYLRQDRLQVRYSPTGATGTGSSAEDVGDFTDLLLDVNPISRGETWVEYAVTVPGPGRLAFRYYLPGMDRSQWGGFFGIDTLTIGAPPAGPYPIPAAGETVTWDSSMNPVVLNGNVVIPEGGTVNVEPGVDIRTASAGGTLIVEGVVNVNGTAEDPVTIEAPRVWPPITVIRGRLEAHHVDFRGTIQPDLGSETALFDCTATLGALDNVIVLNAAQPFIQLERCVFNEYPVLLEDSWNILRDVTVNTAQMFLVRGLSVCHNVSVNGREVYYEGDNPIQGVLVNGLHVSGVEPTELDLGNALATRSANMLIGPDVSLSNSQFPIVSQMGVLPGSSFQHTGNTYEMIGYIPDYLAPRPYWANIGMPYCWLGRDTSGTMNIEPGITVKMDYEPGVRCVMNCEGTPERPIVFEALNPAIGWRGCVSYSFPIGLWPGGGSRFENCEFSGTVEKAALGDDGTIFVQNSWFHDNARGLDALSAWISKTQFTNNGIGLIGDPSALLGATNPSSFEGNTSGLWALGPIDARNHWWGHPTGPRAPQNPGGQGDRVDGDSAASVQVRPFRTTRPDFADAPPVVRLVNPELDLGGTYADTSFFVQTGTTYVIRWTANDAGAGGGIVSQRIIINLPGGGTQVIASGLAGDVRSFAWTVPDLGANDAGFVWPAIRVEATDTAGQLGWDDILVAVSSLKLSNSVVVSETFEGQTFQGGDILPAIDVFGEIEYLNGLGAAIVLEADNHDIGAYGSTQYGYISFLMGLPVVSTDAARLLISADIDGNGPTWYMSGYFSIRHDPRLGLIPPTVQLLTPRAGDAFPAGGVVPITWEAGDEDDGLYGIDLMVSYDGGFTWKTLAEHLLPDARSYDWSLPTGMEAADVRVRVIARDVRFQNSTSGHDRAFAVGIKGGGGGTCPGDFNRDGTVNSTDVSDFINAWFLDQVNGTLVTDWDSNGVVNSTDVSAFINSWFEDIASACGS